MNRPTAVLVASCSLLFARSSLATTYQITDLGTLGGSTSYAFGVNIHGEVVGSSLTASGAEHVFMYQNGVMTDLGVLNSGDTFSRAYGVNDSGVISGQSVGATSSPFYYSGGQMQFAGSLGGNYGFATKINNAGQIVGISSDANGVTNAFRDTGGTLLDLGDLSAAQPYSIAYGTNSSGDVTGYSSTSASNSDAFLYRNGSMQDLGNLYSNSQGDAVNDADYVVGASQVDSAGDEHAFLWHSGVMTDLGTTAGYPTSQASDINSLNQIVGTLVDLSDGTQNHGFLDSNGTMVDLNTLLPVDSGWVLHDAQGIDDLGQIVGYGTIDGQSHAYLLSPVPEPATAMLLAVGSLAACVAVRTKRLNRLRRPQFGKEAVR